MQRVFRYTIAVLLVALPLTAVALSGCSAKAARVNSAGSAAVSATLNATDTAGSGSAGSSGGAHKKLAPAQAQQLENELKAMERELNSLNMPSENDFDKAEGQLK